MSGNFNPTDLAIGKSVVASGLRTHYIEAGQGTPVLLLHGSGPGVSAWENWATVMPDLAARLHVIAPDIPGFGATERKADGVYDMAFWVDHLFAFMDALGLSSAAVVGNSFGGMVAMAAALRDPARIDRLILMGSAAGDVPMSEAHKLAGTYDGTRDMLGQILGLFPYDRATLTPEMLDRRYAVSRNPAAQKSPHPVPTVVNEHGERVFRMTPEADLRAIDVPTLILHGRDDKVLPLELAIRLHRAIPQSQLHTFGNCGHWVQLERHAEFVAQVGVFVESV